MSWQVVARKDVEDAIRSYWLWGLTALFVGVLALPPTLIIFDVVQVGQPQEGARITTDFFIQLMQDTMTILVPIIGIVLAYSSVTGERDSGTLKLLLSLPHSRLDVVVGKVIGRSIVLAVSVLAGFAVTAALFLVTPVDLKADTYVLISLLTVLLGIVFVAIAVGVSAAVRSDRWAMIGTVGIYVLFTLLWNQNVNGVRQLLTRHTSLEAGSRALVHLDIFLNLLNPTQAYKSLAASLTYPAEVPINPLQPNVTISGTAAARLRIAEGRGVEQFVDASVPLYFSDGAVLGLLLLWLVGAPLVGYYVFRDSDL